MHSDYSRYDRSIPKMLRFLRRLRDPCLDMAMSMASLNRLRRSSCSSSELAGSQVSPTKNSVASMIPLVVVASVTVCAVLGCDCGLCQVVACRVLMVHHRLQT